ncbi:MAG: TIGR04013 family B12-binding domain/radical SAM domain-containing protein [Candidatus Atribacteria bacterium]|nr:TIGR04013 family B12-binding domain/radical SAM domain-containing protein [Candidatus Atribacteria bacterium]
MEKYPIFIHYPTKNKNSLNALIGALQNHLLWNQLQFFFIQKETDLLHLLTLHQRGLILLSVMTTDCEQVRSLLIKCKSVNSQAKICLGGPHISALPETFQGLADWLVRGEAEDLIQEILSYAKNDFPLVNTMILNSNHRVQLDHYSPSPVKLGIYGFIEITRGCPYGCYFCQTSTLFGTDVRHRSFEAITEYCREMKKKDLTDIRFITPNALAYGSVDGRSLNLNALFSLLERIKKIIGKSGRIFFGSFPSEIRPEFITLESIQLLKDFSDSKTLVFGGQTGSNRLLKTLHRGHTREQVFSAVDMAIQNGFQVAVDFIFGLPGENEDDEKETVQAIKKLIKLGAKVHAHSFLPLPGTHFSGVQPTPISPFLRHFLGKIARDGFLFGQWQTQEKLAQIIKKDY